MKYKWQSIFTNARRSPNKVRFRVKRYTMQLIFMNQATLGKVCTLNFQRTKDMKKTMQMCIFLCKMQIKQ